MSEEQDSPEDDQPQDEPGGPVGGERLAAARREQQISVLEIAKVLHLDEAKVRALERNDFDVLGAAVFAKGHLRKYAEIVGVDNDDVLADYYKLTRSSGMPPLIVERPRIATDRSPGPWIAAVIIALGIAAAAYWWFALRSPAVPAPVPAGQQLREATPGAAERLVTAAPRRESVTALPGSGTTAPVDASTDPGAAPADPGAAPADAAPEPAARAATASRTAASVADQAAADRLQLTLQFSGDCWTEISDADGRRLFFNMGREGRVVELSGRPPIAVLFGNGDNVQLQVDGRQFELPTNPNNRTVRMTLNPS